MTCNLNGYSYVLWAKLSSTELTFIGNVQQNGYSLETNNTFTTLTVTSVTQNMIYACALSDVPPSGSLYYSGIYSVCPLNTTTTITTTTTTTAIPTIATTEKSKYFFIFSLLF